MDASLMLKGMLPLAGIVVAIVAILMPVALVWVVLHFKQQRAARTLETVRHLADRGLPVPPELLDPPEVRRSGGSALFRAITLLGVGVGLALFFWSMGMHNMIGIGGLVFCIGAAQLIALRIERRIAPPGA